ncbi:MAG TPA: L,D-transpeptidase [Acidimicrobiales bacterium]|nr:L,D-transpeptidase [Acidimicrobiales bacterium]
MRGISSAIKGLGATLATVMVAVTLASCSGGGHPAGAPGHTSQTTTRSSKSKTASLPSAPAGSVLLATTHGTIPGYAAPGGAKSVSIPAMWHGAISTLPVIWAKPGWLDVRLAQRPNGSTAWVRDSAVSLTSTPYRIVVNLKTTRIYLYKSGHMIFSAPAGVGTTADPTPTGQYFVAFFASPPSSGYGAFVLVSSAHSNTISDWEESGDALMAIHGPLGADSEIGTTGALVSHGCVRLHEADLLHLRQVPAGSPIDVVAS